MSVQFAEPARRVLRANWLRFLHFSVDHWPVVTDAATLVDAFRLMVEQTPRISDREVSAIEELLQRQPETQDDGRLKSLLSFVLHFVWLEADNPFLASEDDDDSGSDSSVSAPSYSHASSESDDEEEEEDSRLIFIHEIVFCRDTLEPMRWLLTQPLWQLFEREHGLQEDTLHLFRNLVKQNLEYLEKRPRSEDDPLQVIDLTPNKRPKHASADAAPDQK